MTTSNGFAETNNPISNYFFYTFDYPKEKQGVTNIVIQETQKIGGKTYVTKAWDFDNKKPFVKQGGGYYLLSSFTRKQ